MKGYLFVYLLTISALCCSLFAPFFGICVYILFGVLSPNALWYYSLDETFLNSGFGFSEIVAYPTIIGWVLCRCGNLNMGKALLPLFCLAFYTVWVGVSLAANGWDQFGQVQILMNIRLLLAIVIVLSLCDTLKRLRIVLWVLIFASGFIAYELNMSYLQGFNRLQQVGYAGMDNNFFAVSMVVGSILAFYVGLAEKKVYLKLIAFAAFLCQAHVVMFSMSRGGMLGLLIAFIVMLIIIPKTPQNVTIFLIGLLAAAALFGPSAQERFMTAFTETEALDSSAKSRLTSWTNCAIVMKERPVFGVGVQKWSNYTRARFGVFLEAHSTWFQAAVDSGIPALASLLGFFGFTALRMIPLMGARAKLPDPQMRYYTQMVFAAIISYGISAQFVSLYAMESVFYTAGVGLIILKMVHLQKIQEAEEETRQMMAMQQEMGYSYTRF